MSGSLYPSDITDDERLAGFVVAEITNPDGHYAFSPQTIRAVIYPVDESHRLIKMLSPWGQVSYKLQVYGRFNFQRTDERNDWAPCGEGADLDPQAAVENIEMGMQGQFPDFIVAPAPKRDLMASPEPPHEPME